MRYAIALLALLPAACGDGGGPYEETHEPGIAPTFVAATVAPNIRSPTEAPTWNDDHWTVVHVVPPPVLTGPRLWMQRARVPLEWRDDLMAIGRCESGHNPLAVGDRGSSLGWLQEQPQWHLHRLAELGYPLDPDLFFDPVIAAEVAVHIRTEAGGWWPWTCARVLD